MSSDVELLPTKRGVSWPLAMRLVAWSLPFLAAAALAYAKSQFATQDQFTVLSGSFSSHTAKSEVRIHSLEEYRQRDDQQSAQLSSLLKIIGEEQSSQKALLKSISATQDRVLNRLDSISDRQLKTAAINAEAFEHIQK